MCLRIIPVLLVLLLISCEQSTSPDKSEILQKSLAPGDTTIVELRVGESFKLNETTTIKFNRVISDSRCPEGVDCIWAGNGEVELMLNNNDIITLNTTLDPREINYKDYKINLTDLSPYPKVDEEIEPNSYIFTLEITTSENNVILISNRQKCLIATDKLDIDNLQIRNDSLSADVSYSGGCKYHDIRLYGFTEIMESFPPRMRVQFSHNDFNDPCDAYPTERKAFNILPIKEFVSGEGYNEIILVLYAPHSEEMIQEISYKF